MAHGEVRRRKRKRHFAWQSCSEEGSDGGTSPEQSSPSTSPCEFATLQPALVIQSTVGTTPYLELRERCKDETDFPQLLPPLRAAAVARRRGRLGALRSGGWSQAALAEAAAQLRGHGFVVADDFHGSDAARMLRGGLQQLPSWVHGRLGGAASNSVLRGDLVAWPDTTLPGLRAWLHELDSLVAALRALLPRPEELAGVTAREPPMASCYPTGAKYIRHYDNNCEGAEGDCNGRRLTAVYYLNDELTDADGGHLRLIGRCGRAFDVLPRLDVLVLFWSDRRTPHEVLPNRGTPRFALTCWYVDVDEAPDAAEATLWEATKPSSASGDAALVGCQLAGRPGLGQLAHNGLSR